MLDRKGVIYCLDGGTLLGIAREGRLLPWDDDMDLFVPASEVDKLRKCILPLWLSGLRVRTEAFESVCGPAKPGDLRVVKFRNRKRLISRGEILLDIFVKYADEAFYHWSVGKGEGQTVNKKVPRHFYDNLATLEFDGKTYPVPADLDGYLTCRYGDWRTPVEAWNYRQDDLAAVSADQQR
ncbi:LicD family protein [Marinospirillum alkaliphilum]|uniref:LicD family protein n=1 Tax=Marinospirillum alkaliphilum TaxID=148454 RepID=UPI0015A59D7D|nr:LicD family protein [Marinospirillum alkaliphilum]